MNEFRQITAQDTQVTLIEFVESIVARLGRQVEYEDYRSVSKRFREPYHVEGQGTPLHRDKPDPRWPHKVELVAEVRAAFFDIVEEQGWEVTSQPGGRVLLRRELRECELDIYAAILKRGSTLFSCIHLSRKTMDFEAVLVEQFEFEAASTPPGQFSLGQIFDNMLKRCNFSNAIRDETKKRIMATANIDKAHRKTGPKPKKR